MYYECSVTIKLTNFTNWSWCDQLTMICSVSIALRLQGNHSLKCKQLTFWLIGKDFTINNSLHILQN